MSETANIYYDNGWYWVDQDNHTHGPFASRHQCREAYNNYLNELTNEKQLNENKQKVFQ